MGENRKTRSKADEIIAAFDRERAVAREHHRRHIEWLRTSREIEWLRTSREKDQPAFNERQRKQ